MRPFSFITTLNNNIIGRISGTTLETFLGYVNEVRIWNMAKTQAQISLSIAHCCAKIPPDILGAFMGTAAFIANMITHAV